MDDPKRFQEDLRILREQVFNLATTVHKLVESVEHLGNRIQSIRDQLDYEDIE